MNLPLVSLEDISFGLRFGFLTSLEDFSLSSFKDSGASFFFSIPFRIYDDEIRLGLYLQRDGVYYNLFNENYKPSFESDSFAIFFDSDLNFDHFGLNINTFINLSSKDLSLYEDSSYFDISASFSLGNMDFTLGARKQNLFTFRNYIETSDFYLGLGMTINSIETKMQIRYRNGQPEIGFSSSLAFIDAEISKNEEERFDSPVDLTFSLGFENYFEEGLFFNIIPVIKIHGDEYSVSFRLPLYLEIEEMKLSLVSLKADPWFDMWQDNSSLSDVYDSITDMFSLIEEVHLGRAEETTFFIDANRMTRRNDVFFENYKSFDALSLDTGFHFYNLDFGLYIDDLEAVKIIDPYITFYPFSYLGAAMSISAPTELRLVNAMNFTLNSFLGLTYTQPFLNQRLNVSLFLYGELFARYENGSPVETGVIYDFDNNELYGYLVGAEINWKETNYEINLSGGIHSGRIYPNYFNSFTALNPDLDRTQYQIEGLSYYLIFDTSLNFENFSFLFKYSMPNIAKVFENIDDYYGDMLTLDLSFTLNNGVGLHFSLSRNNFISTLDEMNNFYEYLNSENTIYSAALVKEFDDLTLEVELSTVAIYEEGEYMNSYRLSSVSPRLKVNARVGF